MSPLRMKTLGLSLALGLPLGRGTDDALAAIQGHLAVSRSPGNNVYEAAFEGLMRQAEIMTAIAGNGGKRSAKSAESAKPRKRVDSFFKKRQTPQPDPVEKASAFPFGPPSDKEGPGRQLDVSWTVEDSPSHAKVSMRFPGQDCAPGLEAEGNCTVVDEHKGWEIDLDFGDVTPSKDDKVRMYWQVNAPMMYMDLEMVCPACIEPASEEKQDATKQSTVTARPIIDQAQDAYEGPKDACTLSKHYPGLAAKDLPLPPACPLKTSFQYQIPPIKLGGFATGVLRPRIRVDIIFERSDLSVLYNGTFSVRL